MSHWRYIISIVHAPCRPLCHSHKPLEIHHQHRARTLLSFLPKPLVTGDISSAPCTHLAVLCAKDGDHHVCVCARPPQVRGLDQHSIVGHHLLQPNRHLKTSKHHAMDINRVGQNHIYTVYIRCFRQGNHQVYGHVRCMCTDLANPRYQAIRG